MGEAAGAVGLVASVIGDVIGGIAQNQQNQQTQAFENSALNNQSTALQGIGPLATQLANGIPYQQLLDVQKGGIQSLKSQVGGVPNMGTLIKQLFGQSTTNALDASIQNKQAGLEGAGSLLLGTGSQYGQDARAAMGVPQPNPWAALFSTLGGIGGGSSGSQPTGNVNMSGAYGGTQGSLPGDPGGLPGPMPGAVGPDGTALSPSYLPAAVPIPPPSALD